MTLPNTDGIVVKYVCKKSFKLTKLTINAIAIANVGIYHIYHQRHTVVRIRISVQFCVETVGCVNLSPPS